MNVFTRAEFPAKLDSRGRVTVPSRYRERFNLEEGETIRLSLSTVKKVSKRVDNSVEARKFVSRFEEVESFRFDGDIVEVLIRG